MVALNVLKTKEQSAHDPAHACNCSFNNISLTARSMRKWLRKQGLRARQLASLSSVIQKQCRGLPGVP